jgi:putative heme-binding domain-containing protein
LQVAREGSRNEPDLVWALTRGANLEAESQTLSDAELKELAASAMKQGDPARGEKIFRRNDLACLNCHAIGGVGGKVGPDLTSIGASAQPDYLVESVLYPNRKIKEGYHAVSVETKDSLDYTGVLVSENTDQLILRDASGKETTVAKKNIETRTTGGSLMPSGLVDSLAPNDRLDLVRFLAELGKPGPYDASKGTVARSWRLLVQTLDLAQFGDDRALKIDLNDKQWTPANSLVDGELPKGELAAAMEKLKSREPSAIYAAAKFEVSKNGAVNLKLVGPKTYSAWVDGKSIPPSALSAAELTPGTHIFITKLDAKNFPDALRLESPDVTFLSN